MKTLVILFILFIGLAPSEDYKYGSASYYGTKFHGKTTASGEKFNMYANTAAHKTLPFGTKVEVINLRTNKSIVVRINDRGPYVKGRTFDLSKGVFDNIGNLNRGVIKIKYKILK